MCQQFVVGDVPSVKMMRDGQLKPFIINEIEASEARTTANGAIEGGVKRHFVVELGEVEEGDSVPAG
jgi:hypothetical protein